MNDLPALELSTNKKQAIFSALTEMQVYTVPRELGDVTIADIVARYHVNRQKAKEMMVKLVAQYPDKYKLVMVTLLDTYHNRPGWAIRKIDPIQQESTEGPDWPHSIEKLAP